MSKVQSQRNAALKKVAERKQETRRKIEFGGLVVKSKMSQYSKDIILGALLASHEEILQSSQSKESFRLKGEKAFCGKI